jgi:3-deoxy-7-phosphoheptulonate synthase
MPGVGEVVRVSKPYKLVSRENHPTPRRHRRRARRRAHRPDTFVLIAGPVRRRDAEQTFEAADMAKAAGATMLRGGAYKPRTSPYAFQGLGVKGLEILAEARSGPGLPVVTEVVDPATSPSSRSTPTCCRSAPATCRTSRCCRRSAACASR